MKHLHLLLNQNKRMLKLSVITLICISTITFKSYSQGPTSRITTAREFNKRSTDNTYAYDITTDNNGYIFFTGEYGIFKSNGYSFRKLINFSNSKQRHNIYTNFFKDYDGRIWLTSKSNLSFIRNDSIIFYDPINKIDSISSNGKYESVYSDSCGLLHIALFGKGHVTIDSSGSVKDASRYDSQINGYFIEQLNDGKWFHYSIFSSTKADENLNVFLIDKNKNSHKITSFDKNNIESNPSLVVRADKSIIFSIGTKEIIHFKDEKLISQHSFNSEIIGLFNDSRDYLWVGTLNDGFYRIIDLVTNKKQKYWEDASSIETEDSYAGLWFKTNNGSFGRLPYPEALTYSEQNGYSEISMINQVVVANDSLIIRNQEDKVYCLFNDILTVIPLPEGQLKSSYIFFEENSHTLWSMCNEDLYYRKYEKWNKFESFPPGIKSTECIKMIELSDSTLFIATKHDVFSFKNKVGTLFNDTTNSLVRTLSKGTGKRIWIAKEDRIFEAVDNRLIPSQIKVPAYILENQINHMFIYKDKVWIQGFTGGLHVIVDGEFQPVIDQYNDTIRINDYFIDKDNILWGISNKAAGLCRIDFQENRVINNYFHLPEAIYTSLSSGKLIVKKDSIYYGTGYGLYSHSIEKLTPLDRKVISVFSEIQVNYIIRPLKGTYNLTYKENNINVKSDLINFIYIPPEQEYMMEGLDSIWRKLEYKGIQFTNLDPGKYVFKLRSRYISQPTFETKSITFFIAKPYWLTWWFFIIVTLFVLILIFVIYKIRIISKRKKAILSKELDTNRQLALRKYMNPHFIFNSLNSIQSYVVREDKVNAQDFISRFSVLMREYLEAGINENISLNKEMQIFRSLC